MPLLTGRVPSGEAHYPTWEQAVALDAGVQLLGHYTVTRVTERLPGVWRPLVRVTSGLAVDTLLLLGSVQVGWTHEEGHRSVLGYRGISSVNGVNDPPGSWPDSYRPVYGIADSDMVRLKRDHPADMVRHQAAGWESELLVQREASKRTFEYDLPAYLSIPRRLLTQYGMYSYLDGCLDQGLMQQIFEEEVAATGTEVFRRDFTGPDCTGWVYDLHRPDEPYEARGPHPSGVGLRRDRLPSDLTFEEWSYLRRQRNLSFLNVVDPQLFGFTSFSGVNPFDGQTFRWNASLAHTLTSFGNAIDANVLFQQDTLTVFTTIHGYTNSGGFFPGLTVELSRYPLHVLGGEWFVSGAVSLWMQPEGQRFASTSGTPGGLLSATISRRVFEPLEFAVRLRGKTEGWVAGHPVLDPMFEGSLVASVLLR
jgi:hypothetical protein